MPSSVASAFRSIAQSRRSARRFQPNKTIPNEIIRDIVECTLRSPSGFNLQPTQVMLVRDVDKKNELARNAMLGFGNINRTKDASAVAIFLADLEPHKRLERIIQLEKESKVRHENYITSLPISASFLLGEGNVATFVKQVATDAMSTLRPVPTIEPVQVWSAKNTALMAQTFVYSATSHGLATCMMEGFDARKTKAILRIPDRYSIPLMVVMGYNYEGDDDNSETAMKRTPRLQKDEVFFGDTFGERLSLNDSEGAPLSLNDREAV